MELIAHYTLAYFIIAPVCAASLWLGAKVTRAEAGFVEVLVISGIAAPFLFLPYPFDWASVIVLFYLLHTRAKVDFWPDAVLMVVVARFFAFIAYFCLGRVLG